MKKDAQYFETVIIGTGFSGLLAAIGLFWPNETFYHLIGLALFVVVMFFNVRAGRR